MITITRRIGVVPGTSTGAEAVGGLDGRTKNQSTVTAEATKARTSAKTRYGPKGRRRTTIESSCSGRNPIHRRGLISLGTGCLGSRLKRIRVEEDTSGTFATLGAR